VTGISRTIYHGDCRDWLKQMPANCFESSVTDPPYGLEFMGKDWDRGVPGAPFWREVIRVLKPGAYLLAFGGGRTYHRLACAIEDAGFEIVDCLYWLYGQGFPKSLDYAGYRDKDKVRHVRPEFEAHPQAEGWGTALKPACEPIVLARKPLDGTFAENVLRWGIGGLNIDGCRVPTDEQLHAGAGGMPRRSETEQRGAGTPYPPSEKGRWPANVMHDGSDQVLQAFALYGDGKGAAAPVLRRNADKFGNNYGTFTGSREESGESFHSDTGTAARFFYCAKVTKQDRDEGLDHLPIRSAGECVDRAEGSAGMNSPRAGAGRTSGYRNHHPTVKPTALMQWLCRLVTPPGGTVLDPFAGSGSTGKAAVLEGFGFAGVEKGDEYIEIAQARAQAELVTRPEALDPDEPQADLFGSTA